MNISIFYALICCICVSGCIQGFEDHDRFSMGGPIFWGAATGHIPTVKKCLKAGVNVNSGNDEGDTPLILSVENNQVEIAKMLLSAGAKPSIKNKKGESALDIANNRGNQVILNLMINPAI